MLVLTSAGDSSPQVRQQWVKNRRTTQAHQISIARARRGETNWWRFWMGRRQERVNCCDRTRAHLARERVAGTEDRRSVWWKSTRMIWKWAMKGLPGASRQSPTRRPRPALRTNTQIVARIVRCPPAHVAEASTRERPDPALRVVTDASESVLE